MLHEYDTSDEEKKHPEEKKKNKKKITKKQEIILDNLIRAMKRSAKKELDKDLKVFCQKTFGLDRLPGENTLNSAQFTS
jgi:hypothetical protein